MIINAIKVKNLTFWVNFDEFQELRASFIDFCSSKHQDLLKEARKFMKIILISRFLVLC